MSANVGELALTCDPDPETRNLSLEEVNCLFTGPKIVMHIADAEIDMETMRPPTIKEAEVQRKYSVERIEK
jgi:hypothetical protein